MESANDEMAVINILSEETRYALTLLVLSKKGINQSAAYCAQNAFVSSKAQAAIYLLDETERILRSISRRL
jgi:hypothetical protein